ncbi:MAG: DUF4199 domain-containing protein [Muribaculaceae bacterium]
MDNNENQTYEGENAMTMAANNGVFMGIYLSCLFLGIANSDNSAFLAIVSYVMLLCFPLVVLRQLRVTFVRDQRRSDYFKLWSIGTMTVVFGSLICALVSYLWLVWLHPGFIYEQAQRAVEIYMQMPELKDSQLVLALQSAIKDSLLPTPIEFVTQMSLLTVMIGALVSALMAALARIGLKGKPNNQ